MEFAMYGKDLVEILSEYTDINDVDWCTVAYTDGSPEFDVKAEDLKITPYGGPVCFA